LILLPSYTELGHLEAAEWHPARGFSAPAQWVTRWVTQMLKKQNEAKHGGQKAGTAGEFNNIDS